MWSIGKRSEIIPICWISPEAYRRLPARRDLFWEDYARSSSRKKVTWIEIIITPEIMAYFWQFSFCIHKNIQVFIWKRSQSQFSLITGEKLRKTFNLDYLETALSASERAKYLLAGSRRYYVCIVQAWDFSVDFFPPPPPSPENLTLECIKTAVFDTINPKSPYRGRGASPLAPSLSYLPLFSNISCLIPDSYMKIIK